MTILTPILHLVKECEKLRDMFSNSRPGRIDHAYARLKGLRYARREPRRLAQARAQWQPINRSPKLTVVIPTHNRAEMLQTRSLKSAIEQDHENTEIIVCAHGCTDETSEVVRGFSDARIKLVDVPRVKLGYPNRPDIQWFVAPVVPLNVGCSVASGSFIAILGDDDRWKPDHLSQALGFLLASGKEFVSSQTVKILDDGEEVVIRGHQFHGVLTGGVSTWVYREYLRLFEWNIDAWRKTWDRPNDYDMAARMIAAGVRMGFNDVVGHEWLLRPGQRVHGSGDYFKRQNDSRVTG